LAEINLGEQAVIVGEQAVGDCCSTLQARRRPVITRGGNTR
jgi:hypothetical protein